MSKIEEMSAKYTDERLNLLRPDIRDSSYSRHTKMTLDLFDGYELESAFEEGAKAVLEEIEKILAKDFRSPVNIIMSLRKLVIKLKEK